MGFVVARRSSLPSTALFIKWGSAGHWAAGVYCHVQLLACCEVFTITQPLIMSRSMPKLGVALVLLKVVPRMIAPVARQGSPAQHSFQAPSDHHVPCRAAPC
jgi:hypothetical protein